MISCAHPAAAWEGKFRKMAGHELPIEKHRFSSDSLASGRVSSDCMLDELHGDGHHTGASGMDIRQRTHYGPENDGSRGMCKWDRARETTPSVYEFASRAAGKHFAFRNAHMTPRSVWSTGMSSSQPTPPLAHLKPVTPIPPSNPSCVTITISDIPHSEKTHTTLADLTAAQESKRFATTKAELARRRNASHIEGAPIRPIMNYFDTKDAAAFNLTHLHGPSIAESRRSGLAKHDQSVWAYLLSRHNVSSLEDACESSGLVLKWAPEALLALREIKDGDKNVHHVFGTKLSTSFGEFVQDAKRLPLAKSDAATINSFNEAWAHWLFRSVTQAREFRATAERAALIPVLTRLAYRHKPIDIASEFKTTSQHSLHEAFLGMDHRHRTGMSRHCATHIELPNSLKRFRPKK